MYASVLSGEVPSQAAQLQDLTAGMACGADRLGALAGALQTVIVGQQEQAAVARLRYRAYLAAGAVPEDRSGAIWEAGDSDANARTYAVLLEGEPIASIRVHIARGTQTTSPACTVFPEVTSPWLASGCAIVDSSCFCVEPQLARDFPQLALLAVRIPVVLAQAFAPSWLIATPRRGHEGFYLRNFGGRRLAEPRVYPGRERPLALVGNRMELVAERIFGRYPTFRADAAEQAAMRGHYREALQ
ncbi:N-acyl amino acid synthase FeeM domain-containing protein [Erythrobacter sp. EC-HK427]|uniref:N-acyl amino acid synthase FeeM domain-containing protein n=1 Tax=Erythrobacter sp. EC-HK427 TaxID=2038396 RepID=UPI001257668E|nr:hypothetical protein [Erythrobacter sp. EC-HK427]VVT04568.1 conserved hypothetical protein [Erythrobacter sp. EC-HK427]